MKKFRRLMLWLGLIFIVLLTGFSIYGAFLGAKDAKIFFNSIPLAVYWTVFGIIIAASLAVFPRMLKTPGLFAMHLGCVLIIAGSMWGSQAGHEVQRKYFGSDRIQSASMSIVESYDQDKVYVKVGSPVNQSLANIEIDGLVVEYSYDTQSIDFISDGEIVRQERVIIGHKVDLGTGNSSIMPLRVIDNLGFKTIDAKEQAQEQPGGLSNPALEILYLDKEGAESKKILADTSFYSLPFDIKLNDFRIEHYPEPRLSVYDIDKKTLIWSGYADIGKEIDLGPVYGKITPSKAYKNMILDADNNATEKGGQGSNPAVEILINLPDTPEQKKYAYTEFPGYCKAGKLDIYFDRTISDYISELCIVTEDGKIVKSKDIEVNSPLFYGGYHFYQSSYQDVGEGKFATILSLTSDSGLYCVFAGFFAMCAGIAYHQWLRPILKTKRVRKTDGN